MFIFRGTTTSIPLTVAGLVEVENIALIGEAARPLLCFDAEKKLRRTLTRSKETDRRSYLVNFTTILLQVDNR